MDPNHGTQRLLLLVDQLADEHGRGYGWRSAVAERMGVHRSTLTRILKGERQASAATISTVCEKLNLAVEFFTSVGGPTSYTAWLADVNEVWDGYDQSIDVAQGIRPEEPTARRLAMMCEALVSDLQAHLRLPVDRQAARARDIASAFEAWRVTRLAREVTSARHSEGAAEAGLLLATRVVAELLPLVTVVTGDDEPSSGA